MNIVIDPETIKWLHAHLSLLLTEWLIEQKRINKSESPIDSTYAVVLAHDIAQAQQVLAALASKTEERP
jgi:hypothetical protein